MDGWPACAVDGVTSIDGLELSFALEFSEWKSEFFGVVELDGVDDGFRSGASL